MIFDLELVDSVLRDINLVLWRGRVTKVQGLVVHAHGVRGRIGSLVEIVTPLGVTRAEVVGFVDETSLLMPFGDLRGVGPGATVVPSADQDRLPDAVNMLGRVVDPFGQPLDRLGPINAGAGEPLHGPAPHPMARRPIDQPLDAGVRALNAFITCGVGQRVGIFAGAGVGKSTLLGMLARHVVCDAVVVGLIGERGREVRDVLENSIGDALPRCVCVVATSDTAAVLRVRAAHAANAIADGLRRRGMNVLLLIDSLTRVALAQREIGLSVGEPPTTRGFPPSAFAILPPMIERAGCGAAGEGAVTAFYTVLVEGDAVIDDPIGDAVRGLLDGHIVLDRKLADRGVFPPIEVVGSLSRVMPTMVNSRHRELARQGRELRAAYREAEDLITMGAYKTGSNPAVDRAIAHHTALDALVRQAPEEHASIAQSLAALAQAVGDVTQGVRP